MQNNPSGVLNMESCRNLINKSGVAKLYQKVVRAISIPTKFLRYLRAPHIPVNRLKQPEDRHLFRVRFYWTLVFILERLYLKASIFKCHITLFHLRMKRDYLDAKFRKLFPLTRVVRHSGENVVNQFKSGDCHKVDG